MRTIKLLYLLVFMASLGILVSCSKKDSGSADYNADKTALKRIIDSLTNVYNTTSEGSHPGQYVIGSRTTLDSVINLSMQVYNGTTYTQQQVNNALQNLLMAGQVFGTKLLQEVSVANLMALWKFNGNTIDSSGHGHTGILKTGYIGSSSATAADGATLPQLTTDRFGRANMAYEFNNGATIEVPYDGSLNPQSITICAWVKRHTTNAGNYILSLNRWDGYKFQLQGDNFLFFTFHDTNNNYHDVDDNPGTVPQDTWTHCVISYTNGTIKFYINGALTKSTSVSGTPITVAPPVNLSIGNELPKASYDLSASGNFYGASYFVGTLDDIRIYNKVLTDAEVLSIYTQEKTL